MKLATAIHIGLAAMMMSLAAFAFDSGSTGADGAFAPVADVEVSLPTSGILNYTTINIPVGVTVTYTKNPANTAVILLASGNVTIAGTIDIAGGDTVDTSDGDRTNDAQPGVGGPGGADGGHGGYSGSESQNDGGHGQGPGGGEQGLTKSSSNDWGCAGGGGGYHTAGTTNSHGNCTSGQESVGGPLYGVDGLVPLLGGSGGGGGAGRVGRFGSGGGGGGGALLLASSGTITLDGTITADGGASGTTGNGSCAGTGGGGSGGGIRFIATTLNGTGAISAIGGIGNKSGFSQCDGGNGSVGKIRLESENMQWVNPTTPDFSFAGPVPVFIPNLPGISITAVAGISAPAAPTGNDDITLPDNTANPVLVTFATAEIPTGGTITLTATPTTGAAATAVSTAIAGTEASGTASASINLPNGPSVLIASTTFIVTASLGDEFSKYAQGERVEKVRVASALQGGSETTFITVSGKAYTWPSNVVAMN